MKCVIAVFVTISLASSVSHAQSVSAYQLWKTPSFFRGLNQGYVDSVSQQDILNMKAWGATIVYFLTEGFLDMAAPYDTLPLNIDELDERIGYCDKAGLRYAISVRRGPGRGDVYLQGVGLDPPSTVWENKNEQQLYGSMLRWMTSRYASDTLFVGITPTTEPNPGSDYPGSTCCLSDSLMSEYFAKNGIDFNAIMQLWVDSIRVGSKNVPVLIQGPGFSNPDLFSLVPIVNDPYAVYEFHSYRPQIYCDEGAKDSSEVYPGRYLNYQSLTYDTFNKAFIDDSVYDYVKRIEKETGAPIFMGEFGLETRQIGGVQFITDLSDIAIENGWAFTWWTETDPTFNYHLWGGDYWNAVLNSFAQGNSSVAETTPNTKGLIISQTPTPGEFSVNWPEIDQSSLPAEVTIFDMLGRPVLSCTENSSRFLLDLSELGNGIYFISIHSGQATAHALVACPR